MSTVATPSQRSSRQLLKATAVAIAVASVLLVTMVLPAEYGIDPTGVGARLGLDALAESAEAADASPSLPPATSGPVTADGAAANAALAAKAVEAFGASAGQSFDPKAVSPGATSYRRDSLTVILAPGKGAEVKAMLKSGDGMVFQWKASGDVALDMHGERTGIKNAWTSYAVDSVQREGAGTFVAPFDGSHGWYWQNRGTDPVTVEIEASGFQEKLYQP
jgi:hypothetical protein